VVAGALISLPLSAAATSAPAVMPSAPSAPSKPFGVAGTHQIAFEWVAPAVVGTSPITDYIVQTSTNGGAWATRADGVRTATTVTIASLAPTSTVRLRVAATSAAGRGAWSPLSDATRPLTVPGAPTAVTASPRDTALSVSWLPPASDGGSAITSYTVRYHSTTTKAHSITPRIVGGTGVRITDVPWQVEVELSYGTELCGGTLIDTQWVVTAAHCATGQIPASVKVHSGTTLRSSMSAANALSVDRVIVHPSWNSGTSQNDVALLHLTTPAGGGTPVGLYTDVTGPTAGTSATISGWGTLTSGGVLPDQVQRATIQVLSSPGATCGLYGPDFDPSVMLCGGAPGGGLDTCQGDSGGPLVVNVSGAWRLAGITSFGNGCADVDFPGVYTRVSSFASWIQGYVSATWPSVTVSCGAANCTHVTIPSLTNADTIQVQVVPRNAFGLGTPSANAGPFTVGPGVYALPGAPQHLVVEPHDRRVHLSWSPPAANGGTAVIDYVVSNGVTSRFVGSGARSLDIGNLANGAVVSYTVAAVNIMGRGPASASPTPVTVGNTGYVSRSGIRLMDTRATGTTADGVAQRTGAVRPNATRRVQIGGRGSIPMSVRAVVVNVVVIAPGARGSLTLYACGGARPARPNVQFGAGIDATALVVTALSSTGALCIVTSTPTHVAIDAQGWFPTAARSVVVPTTRVVNSTRAARSTLTFPVVARAGVPSTVKAVVVAVTARSAAAGSVVVYPCSATRPSAVSVSTGANRLTGNLLVLAPSATGTLCLYTSSTAAVTVDLVGYLPIDAQLTPLSPRRLVDSRTVGATVDGLYARVGTRAARAGLAVKVLGRAGVPIDASTVVVTFTVVAPAAGGIIRVVPCGSSTTGINISYSAGQTVTNTVITRVGTAGKVCLASTVAADVVVDLVGWFPRL
jgi:hypothetical protein